MWFLLILILYLKHFSVHFYQKYHSFIYMGYLYVQILDKITIWVSFVVEVVKVIWENISELVLWGLHKIFIQTPTNISIRNDYWDISRIFLNNLILELSKYSFSEITTHCPLILYNVLETISGKAWLIDPTGDQRIAVTERPFVNNDFPLFRIYTNNYICLQMKPNIKYWKFSTIRVG